jgi:hypothetical protein
VEPSRSECGIRGRTLAIDCGGNFRGLVLGIYYLMEIVIGTDGKFIVDR